MGGIGLLKGRVALVTGASQGIGRACAMELARMGATVALCARNEAKLAEVADEINGRAGAAAEAEGGMEDVAAISGGAATADIAGTEAAVESAIGAIGSAAHVFALDVGSEDSIKACAKAVIARLGKVEILVNNAGITRDILSMRMKRADWDDVLTTNLTGAFLMSQAVMELHAQGAAGDASSTLPAWWARRGRRGRRTTRLPRQG